MAAASQSTRGNTGHQLRKITNRKKNKRWHPSKNPPKAFQRVKTSLAAHAGVVPCVMGVCCGPPYCTSKKTSYTSKKTQEICNSHANTFSPNLRCIACKGGLEWKVAKASIESARRNKGNHPSKPYTHQATSGYLLLPATFVYVLLRYVILSVQVPIPQALITQR